MTECRAAAKAVKLAMVAPVTNAPPDPAGSFNTSSSKRSETSSSTVPMGDDVKRLEF